jgi:hypothetical protein
LSKYRLRSPGQQDTDRDASRYGQWRTSHRGNALNFAARSSGVIASAHFQAVS